MSDGKGFFATVEDLLYKGGEIYSSIKTAETQAEVANVQAERDVAIAQSNSKKLLYFGMGLLGVALLLRMTKILRSN